MLEFQCPHCDEVLSIPEQFIGTTGTCRNCRKPITIEVSAALDPLSGEPVHSARRPVLLAFHCETTGTSSRRNSILEIAGIKTGLNGEHLDTFWSFANPGHEIPEKVSERTGLTNEEVADAPQSSEVVKRWFEWIGPHAHLFCQHAHFNSKFISAALYKQDHQPPDYGIIDVVHWARDLAIPVSQYRFRTLLEHIGYPIPESHRALDTAKAVTALVKHLTRKQAGVHLEADHSGVISRITGKKTEVVNEEKAYEIYGQIAQQLDVACGEDFYDRDSYKARMGHQEEAAESVRSSRRGNGKPESGADRYKVISRQLKAFLLTRKESTEEDSDQWGAGEAWMDAIVKAAECSDPEKQREFCKEAISLGALDPWPYEQLVDFYLVLKEYPLAHEICEQYFQTEGWKAPRWADISMKLLRRLVRLEKRMAKWGTETELETELGGSGTVKGGWEFNALVWKASAEVQAGGERRKIVREKLSESLTDFIKLIDDLVAAIEKQEKKKVLIVIDTLDHVDHRPIRDIFTNHWSARYGSIGVFERSEWASSISRSSIFSTRPSFSRSSTTRLRAAGIFRPRYGPAFSLSVPSGLRMLTIGSFCRLPTS